MSKTTIFNKVLSVKDYSERMVFRKQWETSMLMATFAHAGVVHDKAIILGVGAGKEAAIFELSSTVSQVHAVDMYANPGVWVDHAPREMLTDLKKMAVQYPQANVRNIVVQHMDARELRYPDNTFDAVFCTGSIEHFGGHGDVSQAAAEIGRVLKPGGIASISTEFRCSGSGPGFPGVLLFNEEELRTVIVEPSGLQPIDNKKLTMSVDEETLATAFPLENIVTLGQQPVIEGALMHAGYVFTSVHLALKKGK